MRKLTLMVSASVALLSSACSQPEGWTDQDRTDFVGNCTSSYISSFEATMGEMMSEVNKEKLDNMAASYCSCSFEAIKDKYDTPEEAFTRTTDELLMDAADCEPTDEDIDDLLIK